MNRIFLVLITIAILQANVYAADKVSVHGRVADAYTEMPIQGAKVTVKDSLGNVLCDSLPYKVYEPLRTIWDEVYYSGEVDCLPKYFITISFKGYTPEEFTATPQESIVFGVKSVSAGFGTVYLRRPEKEKRLGEVTVTATRIKMVMKGDTLEYDASAFQLPAGSMLDNLIRELPGAQLDDDGRITVNGQFVSSLLVNGRKFFAGDPQVALRNLPAYTVQNVQVYRKTPEEYAHMKNSGRSNEDDPLVMDVNLKKQYAGGWIANAEGGYGSSLDKWHSRWMGRMFAMRYNKISYLALYASANNLNDPQKAGDKGEWYKPKTSSGQITTKRAGIEYNSDWLDQDGNGFNTQFDVERQTSLNGRNTMAEAFMQGGNVYKRINVSDEAKSWTFDWSGEMSRRFGSVGRLLFAAGVNYDKTDKNNNVVSAEGESMLPESFTSSVNASMLYLRRQSSIDYDKKFSSSGRLLYSLGVMPKGQSLNIDIRASQYNRRSGNLDTDVVNYFNSSAPDISVMQRWQTPGHGHQWSVNPKWSWWNCNVSDNVSMNFEAEYKFSQKRAIDNCQIDEAPLNETAALPSASSPLQWILDEENSYRNWQRDDQNHLAATVDLRAGNGLNVRLYGTATHHHRLLSDIRTAAAYNIKRNDWQFSSVIRVGRNQRWDKGYGIEARLQQDLPDMLRLLEVRCDADPLVVNTGNSHLKKSTTYIGGLYVKNSNIGQRKSLYDVYLTASATANAIGMARTFDRSTGVTTWRPDNIQGNWRTNLKVEAGSYLDRWNRLLINNTLNAGFRHSSDFSSDTDVPEKLSVNSIIVNDKLRLTYAITPKIKVRAMAVVEWTRMNSLNNVFATFNYLDVNYGLGTSVQLPLDFALDTDLTAYCRRGYADLTMNTTDWVWNLEISKTFGRNKQWTVKATGFDLLQQLPTVQRTLNAQGRSEVRFNSQPSYAIVTLAYRLDIKPKAQ